MLCCVVPWLICPIHVWCLYENNWCWIYVELHMMDSIVVLLVHFVWTFLGLRIFRYQVVGGIQWQLQLKGNFMAGAGIRLAYILNFFFFSLKYFAKFPCSWIFNSAVECGPNKSKEKKKENYYFAPIISYPLSPSAHLCYMDILWV